MSEDYDIPRAYTHAPGKRTDTLLATATSAPSAVLGIHRGFARLQADQHPPDRTDIAHRQAPPAIPPAAPDQTTQIELLLHRLHITEPAMLLHAAAIDQATNDLLAEATAKSRNQTSSATSLPQGSSPRPCQPASLASQDIPRCATGSGQQATHPGQRTSAAISADTATKNATVPSRPGITP